MINYWALLTLAPLLLGAGIYTTTQYAALKNFETTVLTHVAPFVLSYLLSLLAFFLLYFVLPHTKVNPGAALWGAAVAALVWSFAKWGFGQYVTEFIPYSKIYGVLGLVPLGVFWIHITWLIALFGLQLTFTTQHLKTLDAAEMAAAEKMDQEYFIANELTVVNMAREIAEAFEGSEGPIPAERLCTRLDIPTEFGEKVLDRLVEKEILARTVEPKPGFVLARAPAQITLAEITEAVATAALAQPNLHRTSTRTKRSAGSSVLNSNSWPNTTSRKSSVRRRNRSRDLPICPTKPTNRLRTRRCYRRNMRSIETAVCRYSPLSRPFLLVTSRWSMTFPSSSTASIIRRLPRMWKTQK